MKNQLPIALWYLLSSFFCLTILFSACQKEEIASNPTTEGTYPSSIDTYIATHYPSQYIIEVELENENGSLQYVVELNNDIDVVFDANGHFVMEDGEEEEGEDEIEINPENLPQSIQDYLATYYPNIVIVEAEMEFNGNYEVELENGNEFYFSADGQILYIEDNEHYAPNEQETDIPIRDLPQAIKDYITANYPNQTIAQADILSNGFYKVHISGDLELYFDNVGNFFYLETEFRLEVIAMSLPDTVTIGMMTELKVVILNRNIAPFTGELQVNYGIEDELPNDFTTVAEDGNNNLGIISIPPQDSITVKIPLFIDNTQFNATTYDVAISWPEVTTTEVINPVVLGGGHDHITTYVAPQ